MKILFWICHFVEHKILSKLNVGRPVYDHPSKSYEWMKDREKCTFPRFPLFFSVFSVFHPFVTFRRMVVDRSPDIQFAQNFMLYKMAYSKKNLHQVLKQMKTIAFGILTNFALNFGDQILRKCTLDSEFHGLSESLIGFVLGRDFVQKNRKQNCMDNFWSHCIYSISSKSRIPIVLCSENISDSFLGNS